MESTLFLVLQALLSIVMHRREHLYLRAREPSRRVGTVLEICRPMTWRCHICGICAGPPDLHEPPPAPRHEAMVSTQEDAAAWTLERLADAQWAGMAPALRAEPPSPPPPPPPDDPEQGARVRAAGVLALHTAGLLRACSGSQA